MRHVLRFLLALALAAALIGIGVALVRDSGDDDVTRIVGSDGQETIVVQDDDPQFFPLGLFLLPLLFFLTVGLFFAALGGRRCSGRGPGGPGAVPGWVDDWHRRAHEGEARAPVGEGSGITAT
jgi:hypothetical protein